MLCNKCLNYMPIRESILQQSHRFYSIQQSDFFFLKSNSRTFHKELEDTTHSRDILLLRKSLLIAISVRKRVLFVVRVFEASNVLLETSRGFLPLVELAEMVVCHCLQIVCLCCHLMVLHQTRDYLAYLMPQVFMQAAQNVRF